MKSPMNTNDTIARMMTLIQERSEPRFHTSSVNAVGMARIVAPDEDLHPVLEGQFQMQPVDVVRHDSCRLRQAPESPGVVRR